MNGDALARSGRLEELLAALLRYGSWLASSMIGVGLVVTKMRLVTAGIVLFILLPSLRVLLMLLVFLRVRDYRMALAAGLVLTIILVAFLVGIRTMSPLAS